MYKSVIHSYKIFLHLQFIFDRALYSFVSKKLNTGM